MPIFKGYETPCDLLAKLLREGRRVNFSVPGPDDIYDHLFNFCVTIRDHIGRALSVESL